MGETVTMTHPDLPGREIEVHPRGVAVRETSGWVTAKTAAKKAPAKKKAAPKAAPPAEGEQTATSGTDAAEAASKKED